MAHVPPPDDPQLRAWCGQLDQLTEDFRVLTDGLPAAGRRWRPAPGRWSVAEILEHLATTNAQYVRIFAPAVARARAEAIVGHGPFAHGWLGQRWIRFLGPGGKRRARAPAAFVPQSDVDPSAAWDHFRSAQGALGDVMRSADGLHLGRIKVGSVVSRFIRFRLATWFAALLAHEHRHLAQAHEVRTAAEASAARSVP